MKRALAALGQPDLAYPSVLVLGTNGKGSTAALLDSILRCHGLRTGLFTSPHLVRIEERIRVEGNTIAPASFLEHLRDLEFFSELSFFETLTCAAFMEFQGARVELAILEAGMGGRWDATNATDQVVSLLTNVGTDHRTWLGDSRTAIAAEKAAALQGLEGIIGRWDAEVEPVIRMEAASETPLTLAGDWVAVRIAKNETVGTGSGAGNSVHVDIANSDTSARAYLPLTGQHQIENLTLALAGVAALKKHGLAPTIRAAALSEGISSVHWPGRLEWRTWRGRRLLLDGAHNHEAVAAVAGFLDHHGLSGRMNLVFSCLDDKPLGSMAELLRPRVADVTVLELPSPRATSLPQLVAAFPGCQAAATVTEAFSQQPAGKPTLVTGSLQLVGEAMAMLEDRDD